MTEIVSKHLHWYLPPPRYINPYYRVNPDILSLVSDPLPGNGCGSPNHTCI